MGKELIVTKAEHDVNGSCVGFVKALHEIIREKIENAPIIPNPIQILQDMRQ